MDTVYKILYWLGLTPWDRGEVPPELRARIEGPSPLPPGRALDIGCGTGTQSIYMAQHGWTVTAVDGAPRALAAARQKAAQAQVQVHFVEGDVVRLSSLPLRGPFELLYDAGCFHGLSGPDRDRYVREVTQQAAPGAMFLMGGFAPAIRIGPRGVNKHELQDRFGTDWLLVEVHHATGAPPPRMLRAKERYWYTLKRVGARASAHPDRPSASRNA